MKKLIVPIMFATLTASSISFADEHEEQHKRIVVKSIDGKHGNIQQIFKELAPGVAEQVFIIQGEDGETIVETHGEIDFDIDEFDFPRMAHGLHRMQAGSMNDAAANCVLKHINKVHADGAAALLRQACVVLNAEEETHDD